MDDVYAIGPSPRTLFVRRINDEFDDVLVRADGLVPVEEPHVVGSFEELADTGDFGELLQTLDILATNQLLAAAPNLAPLSMVIDTDFFTAATRHLRYSHRTVRRGGHVVAGDEPDEMADEALPVNVSTAEWEALSSNRAPPCTFELTLTFREAAGAPVAVPDGLQLVPGWPFSTRRRVFNLPRLTAPVVQIVVSSGCFLLPVNRPVFQGALCRSYAPVYTEECRGAQDPLSLQSIPSRGCCIRGRCYDVRAGENSSVLEALRTRPERDPVVPAEGVPGLTAAYVQERCVFDDAVTVSDEGED